MGQWYAVEAYLKFKDQDLFCECIKEILFTKAHRLMEKPITPLTCFKALTSNDAEILEATANVLDVYSEFPGLYIWQGVIEDAFTHAIAMGSLKDGSTIWIYHNVGDVTIRVVDGKAEVKIYDRRWEINE